MFLYWFLGRNGLCIIFLYLLGQSEETEQTVAGVWQWITLTKCKRRPFFCLIKFHPSVSTTLQHKPRDTSGNVNKPVIWRKTVRSLLYHFLCVQRVQGWHTLYHCMAPTFTTNISTIAIFSIFMFKVIGLRWIVMMTSAHPPYTFTAYKNVCTSTIHH